VYGIVEEISYGDRNLQSGKQNLHPATPSFDVDGTLGRLAKWLRILGFDAAYPCKGPSKGRFFVTRRAVPDQLGAVTVSDGNVFRQLKEVLEELGIQADPGQLMSRCLHCNVPVVAATSAAVAGKVPERVLKTAAEFHRCPRCGKVFWEGSHIERICKRLEDAGIPCSGPRTDVGPASATSNIVVSALR